MSWALTPPRSTVVTVVGGRSLALYVYAKTCSRKFKWTGDSRRQPVVTDDGIGHQKLAEKEGKDGTREEARKDGMREKGRGESSESVHIIAVNCEYYRGRKWVYGWRYDLLMDTGIVVDGEHEWSFGISTG